MSESFLAADALTGPNRSVPELLDTTDRRRLIGDGGGPQFA
jgi:hypothetical protein